MMSAMQLLSRWRRTALVALLLLASATAAVAAPLFPVRPSANRRYLIDSNGAPFPILGRTAWFVLSLTPDDYRVFIDDTASRGYTAIELHVVNHDPRGNHPPFDGNGDRPFVKRLDGREWNGSLSGYANIGADAPDFTTPNDAYWRFVDGFLARCESRGLLVFLFPAYAGNGGGDQGWMREMVANGPSRMQSYGAWIAARYKHQKNLVWMMGGDMGTGTDAFSAPQADVERALLAGLTSVAGQQSTLFSAEWATESIGTDQAMFGAAMTLNSAYSWSGDVSNQGRRAYARNPAAPAFLLEEPYDEEGPDGNRVNGNATQPVRRFQWAGWLSAIGGVISGNGYVWPFRDATWRDWLTAIRSGLHASGRLWPIRAPSWRAHLDSEGSRDMARLNAFVASITWYELVPSGLGGMRTLVTPGGSSVGAADSVAAAATPAGTLLLAYVPPAHQGPIEVDMSAMTGQSRARWFDPTSGTYTSIASGLPNVGSRAFSTPGRNSAGATDWVLVLDRAAK
jgi:hypothetical protein